MEPGRRWEEGADRWGSRKQGELWRETPQELRWGMSPGKGRNPGSPSDVRKIGKARSSNVREGWTETLEQDTEAEMRPAEGEQRSG